MALRLDPDALQTATPSTLSNLTFLGLTPAYVNVEGVSEEGDRTLRPFISGLPLTLSNDVHFRGGTVLLKSGLNLEGKSGGSRYLVVRDGAVLTTEPNVLFSNVALHVWGGAFATLTGTRFDYPALVDVYILYAGGTLNGDGVVVTGSGRKQEGLFVPKDGLASLTGATFAGLQYGVLVEDGGRATLTSPVLTGSNVNGAVRGLGQLSLTGATIIGADPAAPSTGLMTQYTRVGVGLSAKDTHFDFGPADRPFRFDLEAFAEGSEVTLSGTSFEDGQHGQGYRISGQSNTAAAITLSLLEPAQPDYTLEGLTGIYGAATLEVTAGRSSDGVVRLWAGVTPRAAARVDTQTNSPTGDQLQARGNLSLSVVSALEAGETARTDGKRDPRWATSPIPRSRRRPSRVKTL